MNPSLEAMFSSKTTDWYTPAYILDAAREVLGPITLDPASNVEANELVQADRFFTEADDGLTQHWIARALWLNSPYGRDAHNRSVVDQWVQKLITSYQSGQCQSAILLVNARTGDKWFQPLFDYSICFTRRIRFWGPAAKSSPTSGNALVCFPADAAQDARFCARFRQLGAVYPAGSVLRTR